jgi:hypothetical protein
LGKTENGIVSVYAYGVVYEALTKLELEFFTFVQEYKVYKSSTLGFCKMKRNYLKE